MIFLFFIVVFGAPLINAMEPERLTTRTTNQVDYDYLEYFVGIPLKNQIDNQQLVPILTPKVSLRYIVPYDPTRLKKVYARSLELLRSIVTINYTQQITERLFDDPTVMVVQENPDAYTIVCSKENDILNQFTRDIIQNHYPYLLRSMHGYADITLNKRAAITYNKKKGKALFECFQLTLYNTQTQQRETVELVMPENSH